MAPTDKDLYIKQFSKLKRGGPLYQPCEVQLGDVGFIDARDGFFQKLYNISNPPTNGRRGCPLPINLETTSHIEQWDAIHLKKSKGFGASSQITVLVNLLPYTDPLLKRAHQPQRSNGIRILRSECILIPGSIVVMERLEKTGGLPKYMSDHLDWIGSTFARDLRYEFDPESLILVVRTVKTDRWAIAVNTSSEVVKNVSFNIASTVGATLWGQWSASSLISRRGPFPVTGAVHPTGIEGANQTIFVRRIALRPPVGYFGKPYFNYSVEPTPLQRFRVTIASFKPDWWVVEKPEDTQSLPAAASGSSGSADIEEGSDFEDYHSFEDTLRPDEENEV